MKSIAIFSVATNQYFEYWKNMVISADRYLFNENLKNFHVFTNHSVDSNFINQLSHNSKITIHEISDLGWPLATLCRYKYISESGININDEIFMHIDADMIVVPNKYLRIDQILNGNEIALVKHPGYWRVKFPERLNFYLHFPRFMLKDLKILIKFGGLGTWSKDKKSRAYVSRKNRKKYFCGAVWFGNKHSILKLTKELSQLTKIDLKQNTIPKWNDESYLNFWSVHNNFMMLDPIFCYAEDYQNLVYLNPAIIAVEKGKNKLSNNNE